MSNRDQIIQALQSGTIHSFRLKKTAELIKPCGTSIIITSCNEGLDLTRTVQSLNLSLLPEDSEIVIVENGSKDTITDYLPQFRGVCFQTECPIGVHKARATGAEIAVGKNLVFLDGHMRVEPTFVKKVEKALSRAPDAIISSASKSWNLLSDWTIYGCGFSYKDGKFDYCYNLLEPESDMTEIFMPTGACYAMTRETYNHIGEFPKLFRSWGVSEADLGVRAWLCGKRVVCDKGLTTYHKYRDQFPYSVNNYDIDYNWCVLSLSLFELGPAWHLFVKPTLKRSGEKLRSLLIENFSQIIDQHNEFKKRKQHDIAWLWEKFCPDNLPKIFSMEENEIKELIENAASIC